MKRQVCLYLDVDLIELAKTQQLNISEIVNDYLRNFLQVTITTSHDLDQIAKEKQEVEMEEAKLQIRRASLEQLEVMKKKEKIELDKKRPRLYRQTTDGKRVAEGYLDDNEE